MLKSNYHKLYINYNNNNFKFIGLIATYEINHIFTDCTNNKIKQVCIYKMDTLKLEKCHEQRSSELLS